MNNSFRDMFAYYILLPTSQEKEQIWKYMETTNYLTYCWW